MATEIIQTASSTPADDARTVILNRISWGAVFAGVAAGLAIQLVLNILGASLMAAILDPVGDAVMRARDAERLRQSAESRA